MTTMAVPPDWFRDNFHYDLVSGDLRSKETGDKVWRLTTGGYLFVTVKGKSYLAHRVAWAIVTGDWPDQVDHINHNKEDNRWVNLREVSFTDNNRNRPLQYRNTTGINGVRYVEKYDRWVAYIGHKRKGLYLGSFVTKEDAFKARLDAELALGYHENHGKG